MVHGLAGSAAIALLVLGAIPKPEWAALYLVIFGVGTMVGMMVITTAIALPLTLAGGAMMRLGIYLINDIIQLAGPLEQVSLIGSRVRTGRPTFDNAMLTMSCASGCLASVYASFCVDDGDRVGPVSR